jgi:hypothetical protein
MKNPLFSGLIWLDVIWQNPLRRFSSRCLKPLGHLPDQKGSHAAPPAAHEALGPVLCFALSIASSVHAAERPAAISGINFVIWSSESPARGTGSRDLRLST